MVAQQHIERASRMPFPDYQALMLPVLRAAAKGNRRVPEVADEIAEHSAFP